MPTKPILPCIGRTRWITREEASKLFPPAEPSPFEQALVDFKRLHGAPPREDAATIEKALEEETHARKHRST